MLDFDSEDIDGMDDDVGDEHEPAPIGHWKATSSYDIYMVDTPNEGNGDEIAEDDPSKKQPKLLRERLAGRRRMTITCPPPKTRQASATMNSPYQRIPSNKSASSTGLWPWQIA